jgi:hypothetical protein
MKNIIIIIVIAVVLTGAGIYFFTQSEPTETPEAQVPELTGNTDESPDQEVQQDEKQDRSDETVIGKSVEEREITAYHYGSGDTKVLFVGGIHGGYSWNTALVAYELMDYLKENPSAIPGNVEVTVVPVLNPDGLHKVVGSADRFTKDKVPSSLNATIPGRFNANTVDLNRNFDCDWQSSGTWQSKTVDGGTKAFSEPESLAIKNYIETYTPDAVVVWYSAAGGVYASNCHNGILPKTTTIMNVYAQASGYPAYEDFDFYEITGDMVNWLAKKNIPAISILLSTHEDVEWNKNKAGIDALLKHYAK